MAERYFLDTNVLIYAVGRDPAEEKKRDVARHLLDGDDGALSLQVLHEFSYQVTHPKRRDPLRMAVAAQYVGFWRGRLPIQENTLAILDNAYAVHALGGFSFWDSLIVAAAQAQGCSALYTEDLQDGRIVDRLRIVNPFREGATLP